MVSQLQWQINQLVIENTQHYKYVQAMGRFIENNGLSDEFERTLQEEKSRQEMIAAMSDSPTVASGISVSSGI